MGWDAEDYRERKDEQQRRRAKRLPIRQAEIESISANYEVKKLTDYQYRINGILDLYPIHKRFHNIKTNVRGNYKSVIDIVKNQIN